MIIYHTRTEETSVLDQLLHHQYLDGFLYFGNLLSTVVKNHIVYQIHLSFLRFLFEVGNPSPKILFYSISHIIFTYIGPLYIKLYHIQPLFFELPPSLFLPTHIFFTNFTDLISSLLETCPKHIFLLEFCLLSKLHLYYFLYSY